MAVIGILLFFFEVSEHENQTDQTYDTYTGIILKLCTTNGYALYWIILKKMCISCLEEDKFIINIKIDKIAKRYYETYRRNNETFLYKHRTHKFYQGYIAAIARIFEDELITFVS